MKDICLTKFVVGSTNSQHVPNSRLNRLLNRLTYYPHKEANVILKSNFEVLVRVHTTVITRTHLKLSPVRTIRSSIRKLETIQSLEIITQPKI